MLTSQIYTIAVSCECTWVSLLVLSHDSPANFLRRDLSAASVSSPPTELASLLLLYRFHHDAEDYHAARHKTNTFVGEYNGGGVLQQGRGGIRERDTHVGPYCRRQQ